MPIPDEVIADMLKGHQERMGGIAQAAVNVQQALGKRLTDCIRDPAEVQADLADILMEKTETPQGG